MPARAIKPAVTCGRGHRLTEVKVSPPQQQQQQQQQQQKQRIEEETVNRLGQLESLLQ